MKEIKLTQGLVTQVDDEDFEYLNQWKWHASKAKKTFVVVRRGIHHYKKNSEAFFMHRVIMNTPKEMVVDHKDHNGLNNQKSNLRNCTVLQNNRNTSCYSKSGYLGVYIRKDGYIFASIHIPGKKVHLGYFKNTKEAAIERDIASIKYFGEFANLNFKVNEQSNL